VTGDGGGFPRVLFLLVPEPDVIVDAAAVEEGKPSPVLYLPAGEVITPIQAEAAHYCPCPGIVYLPIRDAPSGEWAPVWRAAGETPLIRAFVAAAEHALTEHPAHLPPGTASRASAGRGQRGTRRVPGRFDKPGLMDRSAIRR
jgi:hypothetical protein